MADSLGLGIGALVNQKLESDLGELLFLPAEINTTTGLSNNGTAVSVVSLNFTKEVKSIAGFTLSSYGAYSYNAIKISDSAPINSDMSTYYSTYSTLSVRNSSGTASST